NTVMVLFQLALSAGAPWGSIANGGRFPGRLPKRLRLGALARAIVLAVLGLIVPIHAKIILPDFHYVSEIGIWIVVVVYSLSLANNLSTSNKLERAIWAPVVAILVACALLVAIL
ncbi:MAG: hypothetical protein RIC89_14935, partial [Pseudomonadales bacterium]